MGKSISIAEYIEEENRMIEYKKNVSSNESSICMTTNNKYQEKQWATVIQHMIRKSENRLIRDTFISIADISCVIIEYINTMYYFLNWTLYQESKWQLRNSFKMIKINNEGDKPVSHGIHCWRISTQRYDPYPKQMDVADYILWGISKQPLTNKDYYYGAPGGIFKIIFINCISVHIKLYLSFIIHSLWSFT